MSWWALEIAPTDPQRARVAAWLVAHTGQAVEERADGRLVAVVDGSAAADACSAALAGHFAGLAVVRRQLPSVDWDTAWRDGLGPRRFGRLVVVPTWVERVDEPGDVVVRLDPETAFGSGEHGSTRAALALLERHVAEGDRFLDLGTGSGILAIAARRLGAAWAAAIEVDPEALPVAERNARRNGVPDIGFIVGDAANLAPLLGPVDLVAANILRLINEALLPEIHAALRPGGIAIFSGMEAAEAGLFLPRLAEAGFRVVDEVVDEGWWGVAASPA